jgi:phage RecT family recombinase
MPTRNDAPPPVERQQPDSSRALQVWKALQEDVRRPDRYAALVGMFSGNAQMAERFLSVTLSALAANSDILERCTPLSIFEAIREAASLGLEPAGYAGEAAIIRYGDQAKLSVMWRGFLKRIRNSGEVSAVDTQTVYLRDPVFELEFGTQPNIRHVPLLFGETDAEGNLLSDRGAIRGFYAWAKLTNGERLIEWMPDVEVRQVRANSPAVRRGQPSPWDNWYTEMGRKSVLRRLAKRLPQEAIQRLLAIDDASAEAEAQALAPSDPRPATAQIAMRAVGLPIAPPEPEPIPASPLPAQEPDGTLVRVSVEPTAEPTQLPPRAPQALVAPPRSEHRTPAPTPIAMAACTAPAGAQRDNETCLLPEGHAGVHRGATWSWPR